MKTWLFPALCIAVSFELGCGAAAQHVGKKAAQGVIKGVQQGAREAGEPVSAEQLSRQIVRGTLGELSQKEQLAKLGGVVQLSAANVLQAATQPRGPAAAQPRGPADARRGEGEAMRELPAERTAPSNSFLRISPDGHVCHFEWKEGRAVEHEIPFVLSDGEPNRALSAAKSPFDVAVSSIRTFFPKAKKPERAGWVLLLQGALALFVGAGAMVVSVGEGSSAGLRLLASAFGGFALVDGAFSLWAAPRDQPVKRLLYRARGVAGLLLGLVVLRQSHRDRSLHDPRRRLGVHHRRAGRRGVGGVPATLGLEAARVRGRRLDARRPGPAVVASNRSAPGQARALRVSLLLQRGGARGRPPEER